MVQLNQRNTTSKTSTFSRTENVWSERATSKKQKKKVGSSRKAVLCVASNKQAAMGGGKQVAECRQMPATYIATQPNVLMEGSMTKQTRNRNWRERYVFLTTGLAQCPHTHAQRERQEKMTKKMADRGTVLLHQPDGRGDKGRGAHQPAHRPL